MIAKGAFANDFATAGDFNTLGSTFVGLEFGHITPLFNIDMRI